MKKVTIYKYLVIAFAVIAVVLIAVGAIIGYKTLPFIGILLISCAIPPLIYTLAKG